MTQPGPWIHDDGVGAIGAAPAPCRPARVLRLERQLCFERGRLAAITAPPGVEARRGEPCPAAPANPAHASFVRRLRSRIRLLELRLAARRALTNTAGRARDPGRRARIPLLVPGAGPV